MMGDQYLMPIWELNEHRVGTFSKDNSINTELGSLNKLFDLSIYDGDFFLADQ